MHYKQSLKYAIRKPCNIVIIMFNFQCCPTDKDMEDEVADYNGDDDNEGEFEADKQAELAQP